MTKKLKLTALDAITVSEIQEMTIDILARTLWGEARGEGEHGMIAVACVILNREKVAQKKGRFWWGNNIIQICQKPYQFSCWNRSDPNYRKLQAVDSSNAHFVTALKVAKIAVLGELKDVTNSATHYHTKAVNPYWSKGREPVIILGNHKFFRLV